MKDPPLKYTHLTKSQGETLNMFNITENASKGSFLKPLPNSFNTLIPMVILMLHEGQSWNTHATFIVN